MLKWDARRNSKRTRLFRQAGFSCPEANIVDVHYDPDRKLDRAQIMQLSNNTWITDRRNVIICGASGSGKSWLACALGASACNAFFTVRYVRMPHMLDELGASRDDEWAKAKKRYQGCDLLIIDDFLLEPLDAKQARELLEIVEARYAKGSMILCSQFAQAGWRAKIENEPVAEAIVDRLIYNSYTIHIQGSESMRKRIGGIHL